MSKTYVVSHTGCNGRALARALDSDGEEEPKTEECEAHFRTEHSASKSNRILRFPRDHRRFFILI